MNKKRLSAFLISIDDLYQDSWSSAWLMWETRCFFVLRDFPVYDDVFSNIHGSCLIDNLAQTPAIFDS